MCIVSAPSPAPPPDTSEADEEAERQEEENRQREEDERRRREAVEEEQRIQAQRDELAREREQAEIEAATRRIEETERQRLYEESEAERIAAEEQAARVAEYQSARSARETMLQSQIDDAFSGYDDAHFSAFESDYLAHHNPAIARNANEARRAATLALAENGNLQSSAATRRFGQIEERLAEEQARVAAEASDAAATYRSNVLASRRALLDQALSSTILGDPDLIPTDAARTISDLDRRVDAFTPRIDTATSGLRPGFGEVGNAFLDVETTAPVATADAAQGGGEAQSFAQRLRRPVTEGSLSLVTDGPDESLKKPNSRRVQNSGTLYGARVA